MDAVRTLAKKADTKLSELPERNRCCGHGGLARAGNKKLFEKTADKLAEMSDKPYIAYCANCREVLLSRGKGCAHILDIALGLDCSMEIPTISQRRHNSLHVKAQIIKELKDEVYHSPAQPWDSIELVIEADLAREIDRKLISQDDMKEAIWNAKSSGEMFIDEADGSVMACLVRRLLTYWVRYKIISDTRFEILDAYYHRMSFTKSEG